MWKHAIYLNARKRSNIFCYDDLQFLFLFQDSWQEIIMNFITNFSSSKRSNVDYDACLVIVNCYIKMTLYILVSKKIIVAELTKIIFEHVMLKFDVSKKVVFDKNSVFISVYWVDICYHMKTKKRLSIVFYSQTDDQIER
jgi:hypothetical protein